MTINKRNNIIIIILSIIIISMIVTVAFLILRKDNLPVINEEIKPKIIEEQDIKEKPRFNGIKLEQVKTICDARAYFNDLKNSNYETIKEINFNEVKKVMEKLPREQNRGPNSVNHYYTYVTFAEIYQEIIQKSANKDEFLNKHIDLQENINGNSISINRFYECEK